MSNPTRRLGRGLSALIPEDLVLNDPALPAPSPRAAPVDRIHPNPEQPRRTFEPDALDELAASIREHGVLSPLLVRPAPDGAFTLISGERRLRAAALAGLHEVPIVVRDDADDPARQLEMALVENLQREDLDPVEEARGYQRLMEAYGHTQEAVARKVGRNRVTVANALRLLRLPDGVQELVREGRLSVGHAKALLALDDAELIRRLVPQILADDLSVRDTERAVRQANQPPREREPRVEEESELVSMAREIMTRTLCTQVQVQSRAHGNGRIVIDYASPEELRRIVELFGG